MEDQDQEVKSCCEDFDSMLDRMLEDAFPFVPFVIPLVPIVLVGTALWLLFGYLGRITRSIERQEALLEEMLVDVRRRS
ncbi:MAG: hypothetical protein ACOX9R_17615 [Armatimonadota bacterium]|jgi:hypothetical protein